MRLLNATSQVVTVVGSITKSLFMVSEKLFPLGIKLSFFRGPTCHQLDWPLGPMKADTIHSSTTMPVARIAITSNSITKPEIKS
jgi:hypothetical protein